MILIDAGPLIAILDRTDSSHHACLSVVGAMPNAVLVTTWPCFAEAMHLLGRQGGYRLQQSLWTAFQDGTVSLHELSEPEITDAARLMEKYRDLPMDLADATLVAVSNATGARTILTLDSDFHVYRLADGSSLNVLP